MSVFVVGLNGCRLMPVSERKARLLLKGGKASVYRKVPFTIKLNYKTGSTVQPGYLGDRYRVAAHRSFRCAKGRYCLT